ncbi:unnamed protein product, partial [Discosporangium mesarthrocarpum]
MKANGARFDKISWPAETQNGIRGVVATEDINSGDYIVSIPRRLMLSVAHAKEDPELGHIWRNNPSLLRGDTGLALFIMQEKIRGEKSFYWPFLRILPDPYNLSCWTEQELLELQDEKLVRRSKSRNKHCRLQYDERTMFELRLRYPDVYSTDVYTFELFLYAWRIIQTRAFGKRLPWTALVPIADCMNHGNVQTKYDFDVDGNDTFRLFPSGENHYLQGSEVLNSYGRRPNDNLLLEYGFSMMDNQWDEVEIQCYLRDSDPLFNRKRLALRANGM